MISYEKNTSPFYKANEAYCQQIEQLFQTLNVVCNGYCNSWGYEISSLYTKNNITVDFRFYKETITRNGSIIPKDSAISEGLDIEINSFNKSHKLKIQKSALKRLFMSNELKSLISVPYYFSSNINCSSKDIINWVDLFMKYDMYLVKLKNGKLSIEISNRVAEPLKLITELEPMIKFYI